MMEEAGYTLMINSGNSFAYPRDKLLGNQVLQPDITRVSSPL
jgi:hypothetical protein